MESQNLLTLIILIGRSLIPALRDLNKTKQADFLNDALAAVAAGKNVDDILKKAADDWAANGAPSFEQIDEDRKSIQSRMVE